MEMNLLTIHIVSGFAVFTIMIIYAVTTDTSFRAKMDQIREVSKKASRKKDREDAIKSLDEILEAQNQNPDSFRRRVPLALIGLIVFLFWLSLVLFIELIYR